MSETLAELERARADFENLPIPSEARHLLASQVRLLEEGDLVSHALQVGDDLPDAVLTDSHGREIRLSELRRSGPVVIVFYRGGWCSFCRIHLRGMQRVAATIEGLDAHLVAISPELPDRAGTTATEDGLKFPLLHDPGNRFAHACGIAFELAPGVADLHRNFGLDFAELNGPEGDASLPVPAVFVVGSDGRVAWRQINPDYKHRPDPDAVVLAVVSLLSGS